MYTPRPWHWRFIGTAGMWRLVNDKEQLVAIGGPPDMPQSDDMHLSAAAPELLEALEAIRFLWAGHSEACATVHDHRSKCDCDWPMIAAKCDAAIAKAKGEAG